IIAEWRRLVKLKKRLNLQEQSQRLIGESAVKNHQVFSEQDSEKGRALCLSIADTLKLDSQHPAIVQWEKQLNESYSAREVTHLFSKTVLQAFDNKAKKLITKMAAESAVIVAISPLAIIDMFFIAWRNIRLINKIAAIYGIELGYFTRLRLLRMVFVNLAFAGATEIVQDLGMDWLSQDITAKLSVRAAQGIGVGLLTARLGIKAMEFCRPLAFDKAEKPKLSHVQKELLTVMKDTVLGKNKLKDKEEV
ncbi:MAG: TIGR01620 family protein, partial [Haemophilus parainfluenzae]|nr:TIGR01620 family protein [Haemophilus parainfluenzae]